MKGEDKAAVERVISIMLALAREHLAAFERSRTELPKSLTPAFLPLALVPAYLKAIERLGAQAVDRVADISAIRKQWLMLRANF